MSLQSTNFLDIANQDQTLTYTLSSSQVDQIVFSNNQITFSTISAFNLSKSDLILYISYFNLFVNSLIVNFPTIQNSRSISLPLSSFNITLSYLGVEHINYTQSSNGSSIYAINYLPVAVSAAFSSRSSVTVTLQEFLLTNQLLATYSQQVALN